MSAETRPVPPRAKPATLASLEGELMRAWDHHEKESLERNLVDVARRAGEHDRAAMEVLLRFVQKSGAVRRAAVHYVPESELDDVEQRTLIAVERSVGNFEERSRFMTWLHSVAINTALAHRRSLSRRREQALDLDAGEAFPDRISSIVVRRTDLAVAVQALPPEQRTALLLWDEGYSYEDIAERVGVPVGTVRSRISRGRERLRELTADEDANGTEADDAAAE
jgi:RNA polymerase sigma-70 factor, ECF subfamily